MIIVIQMLDTDGGFALTDSFPELSSSLRSAAKELLKSVGK
jgi:hypothetical protein